MTKVRYIFGQIIKVIILMVSLCVESTVRSDEFDCAVDVYIRDWKEGFSNRSDAIMWCKVIATNWGIKYHKKYCIVNGNNTSALFWYHYGTYRYQYLGNSWRKIIDDVVIGVGKVEKALELRFSAPCYYRGIGNGKITEPGPQ